MICVKNMTKLPDLTVPVTAKRNIVPPIKRGVNGKENINFKILFSFLTLEFFSEAITGFFFFSDLGSRKLLKSN